MSKKTVAATLFVGGLVALLWPRKARAREAFILEQPKSPLPAIKPLDWSGCGEPPAWCQPRPQFACGAKVAVDLDGFHKDVAYVVNGRTWSPLPDDPARGLWVYEFEGGVKSFAEEAWLKAA